MFVQSECPDNQKNSWERYIFQWMVIPLTIRSQVGLQTPLSYIVPLRFVFVKHIHLPQEVPFETVHDLLLLCRHESYLHNLVEVSGMGEGAMVVRAVLPGECIYWW